jgi:uncharacterized membrane protein YdjX (TVP38/TMEM64 family)
MSEPGDGKGRSWSAGRLVPLGLIVAAFAAFFALDLDRFVSFATLGEHRDSLSAFVAANEVLAAALFVLVYAVAIAVSLPGGAVLTIAGGFLFGTVLGTLLVIVAATLGATALFLAARTAIGDPLRARAGPALKRMEEGFRENALSYLLFLRLIPVFPFWLVNLVPAFLGVPLRTYVLGTFVGIIPGSFVYASVGNGVGALFDAGETPDLGIIFSSEILIPIVGLAVLALLPIAYKRYRASRDSRAARGGPGHPE